MGARVGRPPPMLLWRRRLARSLTPAAGRGAAGRSLAARAARGLARQGRLLLVVSLRTLVALVATLGAGSASTSCPDWLLPCSTWDPTVAGEGRACLESSLGVDPAAGLDSIVWVVSRLGSGSVLCEGSRVCVEFKACLVCVESSVWVESRVLVESSCCLDSVESMVWVVLRVLEGTQGLVVFSPRPTSTSLVVLMARASVEVSRGGG